MHDYAAARANMVESQVRPADVTDVRVQAAMASVPRERFVPGSRRGIAYADGPIELVPGRFLMAPRNFARLLQAAKISSTDSVLDVGCGSGYSTAVLAKLAGQVIGLEEDADLVRTASETVPATGASNAVLVQGSLRGGHKAKAPYDVIVLEGSVEQVPDSLLAQLGEGGRLLAIVQSGEQGQAHVFERNHGNIGDRIVFDAASPRLPGFNHPTGFVF